MVAKIRRMVWDNYPHECHWCKRELLFDTFTVEHLLERVNGGTNALSNLRPACGSRKTGGCGENFARGNRNRKKSSLGVDNSGFFKS
ncbi:HNH endonuclease [Arthrobacter phage Atraxa]|uniref:HNH endonuclease n=1 Tax=Arthrobacter phage Atraxa TaxID=2419947 RepID=A0A3G2KD78_9CAUD|nr:HNH endonuclease [Arthrobacter phage Atraxa]AYN56976.1 HNH endonuclease [Arthrobacter phage Atraxa]